MEMGDGRPIYIGLSLFHAYPEAGMDVILGRVFGVKGIFKIDKR